jgi:hypothetical protein
MNTSSVTSGGGGYATKKVDNSVYSGIAIDSVRSEAADDSLDIEGIDFYLGRGGGGAQKRPAGTNSS